MNASPPGDEQRKLAVADAPKVAAAQAFPVYVEY